jgi:hypothetical protein
VSSIRNAMQALGYVERSSAPESRCRYCTHREPRDARLRCSLGHFFVAPDGGCKRFAVGPDAPNTPVRQLLVRIGPTDI